MDRSTGITGLLAQHPHQGRTGNAVLGISRRKVFGADPRGTDRFGCRVSLNLWQAACCFAGDGQLCLEGNEMGQ